MLLAIITVGILNEYAKVASPNAQLQIGTEPYNAIGEYERHWHSMKT